MSRPHDTEYADPVIREPSPASSVGTVYGPDETASSDEEQEQAVFERKWWERLDLRRASREEELMHPDPLFPRPTTASVEEHLLFERVVRNLRTKVEELEENELFEQTMLRGSQAGFEEVAIPKDIESLMRSMMTPLTAEDSAVDATITDGPWNQGGNRREGEAERTKGRQ